MMENIAPVILGIVCIVMGFFNRKGNVSMLHSYHRKNVTEENRIPFGKMVGLGTIIIGITMIIAGILTFIADSQQAEIYKYISYGVLVAGFGAGIGINFCAMKKYNNGIF